MGACSNQVRDSNVRPESDFHFRGLWIPVPPECVAWMYGLGQSVLAGPVESVVHVDTRACLDEGVILPQTRLGSSLGPPPPPTV